MKKFKVSIEMTVSQNWIDDGFDLAEREDEICEAFERMLPYAHASEAVVKVTSITSHQYKAKQTQE
jgi:hypothetical protein